ncbi:hypothetical protein NPIL_286681, partial [Nephila pilipes]
TPPPYTKSLTWSNIKSAHCLLFANSANALWAFSINSEVHRSGTF